MTGDNSPILDDQFKIRTLLGFGFLCVVGAVFVDTTKPLKPILGYQITSVSTLDVQLFLGTIGILLIVIAGFYRRHSHESDQLRKLRRTEHLFTYKGFTVVFQLPGIENDPKNKIPDPGPALAKADRGLRNIIDQDPKAELSNYESVLDIKIVSVSIAKPDIPPDEDIMPIGKSI